MIIPGIGACAGFMISSGLPSLGKTLLETITDAGLTTNLKLCLDAGDSNSIASSSGTKWLDTSGNGYDFFRGTSASVQSTDPTFNGTAGARTSSEFWAFDGGDRFTYDTTNEAWMQTIHKNNAIFSVCMWVRSKAQAASDAQVWIATCDTTGTGFQFYILGSDSGANAGAPNFAVFDAGDVVTGEGSEGLLVTDDTWTFVGFAINEGADSARWQVNGSAAEESTTVVYSSPSTSSASDTMAIGHDTNSTFTVDSGSHIAQLAMWEGTALTAPNLDAIFQATRGRFGV